ncbi:hypothetical protein Tco_0855917 [Tanacetum coccineum]
MDYEVAPQSGIPLRCRNFGGVTASICAFILEMKGYFDRLESLNMVFDAELSINIILSGLPADYNQFVLSYQMNGKETSIKELHSLLQTAEQGIKKIDVPSISAAPVLTVGHNAKKRKTYHSNWKGKAAKGKSDRGSKRKFESEIAPAGDLKEAVCFYCNTKGHWNDLKESRKLKHGELNLVMGNRKITPVTKIGKYELMLNRATLPISFWGYALEQAKPISYILVPTKKVSKTPFEMWKGKRPLLGTSKSGVVRIMWCFLARRGVFLEREMISKEDSGSKIDLEEIQESVDEEPIVNTDSQQEVVTPVEPNDTEDKISDSTLSDLDELANYKEAMASPEAAKWKEATKSEIHYASNTLLRQKQGRAYHSTQPSVDRIRYTYRTILTQRAYEKRINPDYSLIRKNTGEIKSG